MHSHSFLRSGLFYRCACGVYGYRRGTKLVPMRCQHEVEDRKHCGGEVVQVETANKNKNRCGEHQLNGTTRISA